MFCKKKRDLVTAGDMTAGVWCDINKIAEERAQAVIKKYNTDVEDFRIRFKSGVDEWAEEFNIKGITCDAKDRLASMMSIAHLNEFWRYYPDPFDRSF